jgi:hypothetical protein
MAIVPPNKDLELNTWSGNFDTRITATPTAFGLVAGDATAFHALAADYSTKLATATNPGTRNSGTIAAKNTSKKALQAKARQLIKIISAYPPVTDQQRSDLGLNPKDLVPSPVPPPVTRPLLTVDGAGTLRLVDETTPTRRGKPQGVNGAIVFSKVTPVGDPPPEIPDDARFAILATRPRESVPIPTGNKGKMLWVLAQWYNERGELGPVSEPVSAVIAA